MSLDDRTRTAPPADDLTRSLGHTTVARPDPVPGATPSGVRVIGPPDPSSTVVNPDYRAAPAAPADDPPLPRFDQFQPLGEVGRGGMGVVYRALDTHFMRDVAVKVLSERLVGHRSSVRRFLEEARLTAQLTHTAIPPVHQIGTLSDGRPYLTMKLIKGRTLGEKLKDRGDLIADLPTYLGILEQVCQGVGYAHSRGVIHRDLKPGNIMVGAFGEVQVMDWGLAKEVNAPATEDDTGFAVGDESGEAPDGATKEASPPKTVLREVRLDDEEHTRAGTVLGTPLYMSPEQASGDIARVNERSDVFSLGAILCVLLTDQPPYTAKDTNTAVRKAMGWDTGDAFRRLAQCKADPGVIELCKRCLAKDPARRPANGAAVATALNDLKAASAERLRRADLVAMAQIAKQKEAKRRVRAQLLLAAAVLLIVGMAATAGWYLWGQFEESAAAQRLRDQDAARQARVSDDEARVAADRKRQEDLDRQEPARVERENALRAAVGQMKAVVADVRKAGDDTAWDAALARADAAQRSAEKWLAEDPKAPLGAAVRESAGVLDREARYRKLPAALDELSDEFLAPNRMTDHNPAVADRYRAAFLDAGLSAVDAADLTRWVSEHPARDRITDAVFEWHGHALPPERKRLADVLSALVQKGGFITSWWVSQHKVGHLPTGNLVYGNGVSRQPAWVVHRIACDLWQYGDRTRALEQLRAGVERLPADFRLNARLAVWLARQNSPAARGEAQAHAKVAVALCPQSVNARLLLARLCDDGMAADRHFAQAIALDQTPTAKVERAAVYVAQRKFRAAEEEYAALNRTSPTTESRLGAVWVRWLKGDRDGATVELKEKVIPLIPKAVEDQWQVAALCREVGLHAEAEAAHRAAVASAPKWLEPRLRLALHLERSAGDGLPADREKTLRAALAVLEQAGDEFADEPVRYAALAGLYARMGDGPKALAAGETADRLGPMLLVARWAKTIGQVANGQYIHAEHSGNALRALAAAAQGQWKKADTLWTLTAEHPDEFHGSDIDRALKHLSNADVWHHMGVARCHTLDFRGAAAAFAEAVRLSPYDPGHHRSAGWGLLLSRDWRCVGHLLTGYGLTPPPAPPVVPWRR